LNFHNRKEEGIRNKEEGIRKREEARNNQGTDECNGFKDTKEGGNQENGRSKLLGI
jgi:hypothetical protein